MDPEETLYSAEQALSDCNAVEARAHLDEYTKWRSCGGFEPLHLKHISGRGDEVALNLYRRLCDLEMQNRAGFSAFLAAFPQTQQDYGTGGGCTAWLIEKTRGGKHILMTDDNLTQPAMTDSFVSVGSYDEDGQTISDAESGTKLGEKPYLLTWAEAIEWVRAELAKL